MPLINPFKPTAGAEPPVLIGRDRVVADFIDGLDEGVGAPGRLMRITGPRGSGKTVLLTELGDLARERGWTVVDETAGEGLCEGICRALGGEAVRTKFTAEVNAVVLKARADVDRTPGEPVLREVLSEACAKATRHGRGVLITIDEIQDADADDVRAIAAAVQHLIRERQNVALVFAGLTMGVLDLINGKALTFLRRAKPEELAAIPLDDVSVALRHSIEASGLEIDDGALAAAAEATAGYAYLIQLVGYHVWRAGKAHAERSRVITEGDAAAGIVEATEAFEATVLETALSGLPLRAVEYVIAMAADEGASSTGEVANRLGVPASSLTSYRRLLIRNQVIEATARGFVDFSIPRMRGYLRAHADGLLARYGR